MALYRQTPVGPYRGGQAFGEKTEVGPFAPVSTGQTITPQSAVVNLVGGMPVIVRSGVNGTLTVILKNNIPIIQAGRTGLVATWYDSTGALVLVKTGQTSDVSGIVNVNDSAIVTGQLYFLSVIDPNPATRAVGMVWQVAS